MALIRCLPTSHARISSVARCDHFTAGPCVFGQGFWKNHPEAWPVTSLQLGNVTYTEAQLLAILHEPVRGNGLLILAHQEIAAKLNIANGADGSCIQQTLAEADALIGDLVIPPIGNGFLLPRDVSPFAGLLGDFNEGGMCAPACENEGSPMPGPSPSRRPTATSSPDPVNIIAALISSLRFHFGAPWKQGRPRKN